MPNGTPHQPPRTGRRRSAGGDLVTSGGAAGIVAPAGTIIAVFLVFPALWTLYLGLTNRTLTGVSAVQPEVVGWENYTTALGDPAFWNSLQVTLIFVFGSAIVGQAVLGFILAWMFRNWQSWVRRAVELLVVMAWIIPGSVVAFLWVAFLDGQSGTLNTILGIETEWLLRQPLLAIIVFNTWRGTAFSMLLFGAALNSLPPSYLETSRLAGASPRQQLFDIILPSIKGYIITNLLLISLWTFNDFTPYLITGGGPAGMTELLPIYIYNESIRFGELGFGSALSAIMLAINLLIALFYLRAGRDRT